MSKNVYFPFVLDVYKIVDADVNGKRVRYTHCSMDDAEYAKAKAAGYPLMDDPDPEWICNKEKKPVHEFAGIPWRNPRKIRETPPVPIEDVDARPIRRLREE